MKDRLLAHFKTPRESRGELKNATRSGVRLSSSTKLYKVRTKLKNVSFSGLFPSSSAATRVAASGKIYLFENLTSYRRKIVNRANEMRNEGLILSVWTMDGKIFIKTSPEGRPTKINELEDLDYL